MEKVYAKVRGVVANDKAKEVIGVTKGAVANGVIIFDPETKNAKFENFEVQFETGEMEKPVLSSCNDPECICLSKEDTKTLQSLLEERGVKLLISHVKGNKEALKDLNLLADTICGK